MKIKDFFGNTLLIVLVGSSVALILTYWVLAIRLGLLTLAH